MVRQFFTKPYTVEQMPCPFLADKLPAGNKAVYAIVPEQIAESLDKLLALCSFEWSRLGISLNIKGNAIPLYVTPSIRTLMLNSPSFQLVQSILRTSLSLHGSRENIILAIRLRSRAYCARSLCSLDILESLSASAGMPTVSL